MIINLTPHSIRFLGADNELKIEIPPSGEIARVSSTQKLFGNATQPLSGSNDDDDSFGTMGTTVPVFETTLGRVEGYPEFESRDSVYVVSSLTLSALKAEGRGEHAVVPFDLVRDEQGRVIGCRGLSR